MEYILEDKKYNTSYQDLRELYIEFIEMDDDTFLENLPRALHFATFVCFFKEIPTYICLSDVGIIHELVHLLNGVRGTETPLDEIREDFKNVLKICP